MTFTCKNCGKECDRPPSQVGGGYCSPKCAYAALRKERPGPGCRRVSYEPNHPLTGKNGYVLKSRAVLFNQIGWGPHACHWCGRRVDWKVGTRGSPAGSLVADHVDNDPANDAITNLVVACGPCNVHRSRPTQFPVHELHCERCGRTINAAYKRRPPIICRNCRRRKSDPSIKVVGDVIE